jgi:hypothetical protein
MNADKKFCILFYLRSSAANNSSENHWSRTAHVFGPLMNTNEPGFFDSPTERVCG